MDSFRRNFKKVEGIHWEVHSSEEADSNYWTKNSKKATHAQDCFRQLQRNWHLFLVNSFIANME